MGRLRPFLFCIVVLPVFWANQSHAQTGDIRFETRIAEVRSGQGLQPEDPDPISLTDDAAVLDEVNQPLSLNDLSDRVFNARDLIRVRVRLNGRGQIVHLAVLGQNAPSPADLGADEQSFTLFFVDTADRSVTPTRFPFVEVAATTLLKRGTQIFGKDNIKIPLSALPKGSLVEVIGAFDGPRFVAREIRVLQSAEYYGFGSVVVGIERETDTRGNLIFRRESSDRVDFRAPVFLDGESLGAGLEPLANILRQTDEPVVVTLSKQDFFESNGHWGQVDVEVGRIMYGKRWEEDNLTFQLPSDPSAALDLENNRVFPKQTVFPVNERTRISDNMREGAEVSFAELTKFMYLHVNFILAGNELLEVSISISNERPKNLTLTLRVSWFDQHNFRLGFDSGPPTRLSQGTRFLDLLGNPIGPAQLEGLQWEDNAVALVTIDPSSGRGVEVRLVQQGTVPDPGQVIIGEVQGIHKGFWLTPEGTEMNTHGFGGIFTADTIVRSADGQNILSALLVQGVEVEFSAIEVSGQVFLREVIVLSEFQPFEITARIRSVYLNPGNSRIEFEESAPIQVDPNAEVFDHFGDPASLGFLSDLLDQVNLQLRLTSGGQAPDGSPAIARVEAFRPDAEVEVSPDQQLVAGGRIHPWSNPPEIYPQSIQQVNIARNTTTILDLSGNPISARDLENRVRVRVTGQSIVGTYGGSNDSKRTYLAERIEVLGGAVIEYRGILSKIQGDNLIFRDPEPFVVSSRTDLQEETGFQIDFLTLAARIRSEGGLRLQLRADFSTPGFRQVWHARIMRPDESRPSHLGRDEIVAVFLEADEATRTLRAAPIPPIQLASKTRITSRSGEDLTPDALIPGARVRVLAEARGDALVAAELQVEEVPKTFEFTAPIEFVDTFSRRIHFETPPFITIAQNVQILDPNGEPIDLGELRRRLFGTDDRMLRITQALDSPSDAPIAEVVEMLASGTSLEVSANQFLASIDDPNYQIRVREGRIELTPLPPAEVAPDADIRDLNNQTIQLSEIPSSSRVRVTVQEFRGLFTASEVRVVGGRTFTDDAVLGEIDVANRLLTPEPEPPMSIDPRAFIGDPFGNRINLTILADFLRRQPELLLAIQFNPFGPGVYAVQLIDPESGRPPGHDEFFVEAEQVEVDVDRSLLVFRPTPPGRVTEEATIVGPNGETLTLGDLQPGQRIFVRGEEFGDDFLITAITVIPQIDAIQIVPQIGDFDEGGVENDVQVDIVTQDGSAITLPVRIFIDFSPPVETRSGHIFNNLPPGPHKLEVEIPSLPELFSQERVFISARGTAFRVTETSPAADATGVSLTNDITVTFNEPLRQAGDFISISGSLNPQPRSSLRDLIELSDDDKTVRFPNVELEEGTDYTLSIVAATSRDGNILAQPFHIQFSTGQSLAQLGSMAGSVTLSPASQFVGTVRLFDEEGEQVLEAPLEADGRFTLNTVFSGSYRLSAEVQAEDGRSISGFLDADGDGSPDDIVLAAGEARDGLNLALALPVVQEPVAGGGENRDAIVKIDLNTRNSNQSLDSLKVLPDSEVRVAVYATVVNLIGYNVSFSYDTTAVSFKGVDEGTNAENNLLKRNAGLAVTLPPTVGKGSLEYAGAILGATAGQAVTGEGLLGVFRFRTRKNFSNRTEFLVPRVLLQSQTAADTVSALARAVLIPTTRILMTLSADPDTISADGTAIATIRADLKDVAGQIIADQTQVHFEIVSGSATLNQTKEQKWQVVTTGGTAQVELSGQSAGSVVVGVSVDGTSEQITVVLQASAPVGDSAPVGEGLVGPIALDLNTDAGDQGLRQTTATPRVGDNVIVDIVGVSGAQGNGGFQVRLKYDPVQLQWDSFQGRDIFATGLPILPPPADGVVVISVAILGGTASKDSGTLGHATFTVLEGFTGETRVELITASYNEPVEVGSGGATLVIGGAVAVTPDFNGDGSVDFSDFISFAGAFGTRQGEPNYSPAFDLDFSGDVGFTDFLLFAQAFGQPVATKPARRAKPIGRLPGLNRNAGLSLSTSAGERPQEVAVSVRVTHAEAVEGYSLQITYDPSTLEFLAATGAQGSRFTQASGAPSVQTAPHPGTLLLSDLLHPEAALKDDADLVLLRFRLLDETLPGRIEIAQALVSDPAGRINPLTGAHLTELRALPTDYTLSQNYPNPFNPDTVLPFALLETGEVRIAVYNVLGQEVSVLVEGHREAGFHRVVWDGKDLLGRQVSSGVYFVRMVTEGFSDVRKMMLLK